MIPETQAETEDLFESYTKSRSCSTQNTNLTGVLTGGTIGAGYSRTKPFKLHQCTAKCTHDAQKEFDSSENEDEIQEKKKDISVQTMPDETKDVNNKSTVHYHFGNIVAEEIKNLPPSKRIRVMTEILKVIEKFQSD